MTEIVPVAILQVGSITVTLGVVGTAGILLTATVKAGLVQLVVLLMIVKI